MAPPTWAWIGTSSASTSNSSPVYPASGVTAGDAILLAVWNKASTGTGEPPAIPAPSGWTLIAAEWGGTGTSGLDTGPVKVTIFRRDMNALGNENGVTLTNLIPNPANSSFVMSVLFGVRPVTVGDTYFFSESAGVDTTSGTSFSVTTTLDPGIQTDDLVLAVLGWDNATTSSATVEAITSPSATIGTVTERFDTSTTSGNHVRGVISSAACTAGSSTGAPTTSATSAGNVTGVGMVLRIRETLLIGAKVVSPHHPGRSPVPGGVRFYSSPKSTADGAITANAEVAEGQGYSYGLTDHTALLLALDGAQTGSAVVNALPTEAAGTGTAYDATVTTGSSGTNAPAETASGTGTAYDASVAITSTDTGASGTGTAGDTQAAVGGQPTQADGTGSAFTSAADIAGLSGLATGSGAAGDPQSSLSGLPTEAAGTGTGQDAQGATGVQPGAGTGTGAAGDAAGSVAAQPSEAAGTGTISTASDDIQVFADWASGPGVAYDATVQTSGQTNAPAETASGTGTAYDAGVLVAPGAGAGMGTGSANDLFSGASAVADWAAGTGTAYDATVTLPQAGSPTVVSGKEPVALLYGRETTNTFSGRDTGPISGREPLSSTSGNESPSIKGREP